MASCQHAQVEGMVQLQFGGAEAQSAKAEQEAFAQVMEQLLRVVPDIRRIYVIIRSKRGLSGE